MTEKRIEVVLCQTALGRQPDTFRGAVAAAGGALSTVECFDRCETCERSVLARVDGAMARFSGPQELLDALAMLREEGA